MEPPPEHELPPGAFQVAESGAPGEWPPRDAQVGPAPRPEQAKRKLPTAIIAIIVIGLLVIGGAAAAYFFIFREKKTSEAEVAVEGFLKALYAGDVETAKSFMTPDAQGLLTGSAAVLSTSGVKFEVKSVKLKTIKEAGDEAEVEIVDISLHATTGGFSSDMTLKQVKSMMGVNRIIYRLNGQNGKWLITGVQAT
ncbi:MAG: hypothetical protein JJE48_03675 [Actinobacteria bacterium]|nr:hypothetical protein [Actinomycetota bacterium]